MLLLRLGLFLLRLRLGFCLLVAVLRLRLCRRLRYGRLTCGLRGFLWLGLGRLGGGGGDSRVRVCFLGASRRLEGTEAECGYQSEGQGFSKHVHRTITCASEFIHPGVVAVTGVNN